MPSDEDGAENRARAKAMQIISDSKGNPETEKFSRCNPAETDIRDGIRFSLTISVRNPNAAGLKFLPHRLAWSTTPSKEIDDENIERQNHQGRHDRSLRLRPAGARRTLEVWRYHRHPVAHRCRQPESEFGGRGRHQPNQQGNDQAQGQVRGSRRRPHRPRRLLAHRRYRPRHPRPLRPGTLQQRHRIFPATRQSRVIQIRRQGVPAHLPADSHRRTGQPRYGRTAPSSTPHCVRPQQPHSASAPASRPHPG